MRRSAVAYDTLGASYATTRREDPRIASQIWLALDDTRSVLNVGAGTGNYEPTDRVVVALEPSITMIGQRDDRTTRVVRGVAEELPFPDHTFDAAMAVSTVHHWGDREQGLRELRRVARRQVILFYEPLQAHRFWAIEYFPEASELPSEQDPPSEDLLRSILAVREVQAVLVPRDCTDGFAAAHWARPEAYLDPTVQAGMSWLALLDPDARERGAERLTRDLANGEWERKHRDLSTMTAYDAGYRLAIAHS